MAVKLIPTSQSYPGLKRTRAYRFDRRRKGENGGFNISASNVDPTPHPQGCARTGFGGFVELKHDGSLGLAEGCS
jgi:hypothetical protein